MVRLLERIQLDALVERGSRDGGEVVAKGFATRGGTADRALVSPVASAVALAASLEHFPFERNRSNDKKSLKIKTLEQALVEKVYQLFRSLR